MFHHHFLIIDGYLMLHSNLISNFDFFFFFVWFFCFVFFCGRKLRSQFVVQYFLIYLFFHVSSTKKKIEAKMFCVTYSPSTFNNLQHFASQFFLTSYFSFYFFCYSKEKNSNKHFKQKKKNKKKKKKYRNEWINEWTNEWIKQSNPIWMNPS